MKKIYGIELFICNNPSSPIFKFIILSNEFWKWIPFYENLYKISNLGRVYSIPRLDSLGRLKKGGIKALPIGINKNYKIVTLNKEGKKISRDVHRLVMEVFDSKNKKQCVNHINGDKKHNWISNLEWTTQSENLLHAYRTGLHKGATGPRIMTLDKAREVRHLSKTIPRKDLAIMYNCSISCIREILVNITWKDPKHK